MTSSAGCLLRAFWMLFGNALLFISGALILRERGGLGWPDAVFLVMPVLLSLSRYVDIRWYGGLTAAGEPATFRHWWRYTASLMALALAIWAALHWGSRLLPPF